MKNSPSSLIGGDMLTAEELYRAEIARLPRWTEAQRQEFVKCAKQGDSQAREHLILSCVGYVVEMARKYATICAAAPSPIAFLDLVQIGNLTIVERMEKALAHPNTIGYLYKAVRGAIIQYCQTRTSLIVTPKDTHDKPLVPMVLQRLDAPSYRDEESGASSYDRFSLPQCVPSAEPEREYRTLHTAVASLSARQRETITRHYGLEGAPEQLTEIGISFRVRRGQALPQTYEERAQCCDLARNYYRRGLKNLKVKLEPLDWSA